MSSCGTIQTPVTKKIEKRKKKHEWADVNSFKVKLHLKEMFKKKVHVVRESLFSRKKGRSIIIQFDFLLLKIGVLVYTPHVSHGT